MSSIQEIRRDRTNLILGSVLAAVVVIGFAIAFSGGSERGPVALPPVPEPLVKLPEELVKDLYSKGIQNVALIDRETNQVKQVLALFPDGSCEACRKLLPEEGPQGNLGSSDDSLFDIVIDSAIAAPASCSPHCDCGGAHCRSAGGSCCKCAS